MGLQLAEQMVYRSQAINMAFRPMRPTCRGALAGLRRAAQTSLQRFEQNFSKFITASLRSARAVDPEPTCYVMLLGIDKMRALL